MSEKLTGQERQEKFIKVFRYFDTVTEGARWIADVTGSAVTTVMVWRTKGNTGYPIPQRPFMLLMQAAKRKFKDF